MAGFEDKDVVPLVLEYRATGNLDLLGKIALACYPVVEAEIAKYPHLLESQQICDFQSDFSREKLRGIVKHYNPDKGKLFSLVTNSVQNFVRSKLIKHRDRGITVNSELALIAGGDMCHEDFLGEEAYGCTRNRFGHKYVSKYIRSGF